MHVEPGTACGTRLACRRGYRRSMANLEANGITIEYDIRGEGEPIIFVMGLAGQLIDWPEEFVDLFVEKGYQAIRFDNRDIGLSSQGTWDPPSQAKTLAGMVTGRGLESIGYTMPDMAADAVGLMDGLGIERAHVVGLSMGGMIAQEMAIGHRARVRSLCSIMSNTGDRRNGSVAAPLMAKIVRRKPPTLASAVEDSVELFRLISGPHFDPDEHRQWARAGVARSFTPEGAARQTAAIAASRDRTKLLGSVEAPTLVVHGLIDPLVKPSGGIATAKAVPGARLLALPDMGHDLPRPRWLELRDAIVENFRRATV